MIKSSVFSNYLKSLAKTGLVKDVGKPSEVYEQLAIAYNQGLSVRNAIQWYVPYYEEDLSDLDDDLLCYICSNIYLRELIEWFNSKTIPEFTTMSYQTIGVRIRIFCSKLNALVDKELVDKEMAIRVHLNLVDTIQSEHDLIINEELPFLG